MEAKNGAVIRKHLGYIHIAAEPAEPVQRFYQDYLNFPRPCGQAESFTGGRPSK